MIILYTVICVLIVLKSSSIYKFLTKKRHIPVILEAFTISPRKRIDSANESLFQPPLVSEKAQELEIELQKKRHQIDMLDLQIQIEKKKKLLSELKSEGKTDDSVSRKDSSANENNWLKSSTESELMAKREIFRKVNLMEGDHCDHINQIISDIDMELTSRVFWKKSRPKKHRASSNG